ncbi:MAG: OmpH family outer membrane protein [Candidatus Riflebacteria bacterium]|nr:OmpH family outer membrane protein [Candidatus Riflebacteria bacterium]MBR4569903.1 OmpH family outer membrane protein [Candidatus Riflebacteria bacterium]
MKLYIIWEIGLMSNITVKNKNRSAFAIGKLFLFSMILLCTPSVLFAINASDVATIDMQLVVNLHPKMALFDFNRIGFYKVKYGLNYDDFVKETQKLKANPKDNSAEIKKLEDELEKVSAEASDLQMKYLNEMNEMNSKKLEECSYKHNQLQQRIEDLKWESANGDLTTRNETKAIKAEILKEIYVAIDEIVKEKKYTLVLNTAVLAPYRFDYNSFCVRGCHGIPAINLNLFLAFDYANKIMKSDSYSDNSYVSKRWLSLTGLKDEKLPFVNHPTVLAGGSSITKDVLTLIYKKHKVDSGFLKILCSVIDRIEALQNGKELEKMVVVDEKN